MQFSMRSCIYSVTFLFFAASLARTAAPDPADLLQQAHAVVAKRGDYKKAIGLLQKANANWKKNGAQAREYAKSLTLLASLYLAEDRRNGADVGIGKDNDVIYSQWKAQSSEVLSEAVRVKFLVASRIWTH